MIAAFRMRSGERALSFACAALCEKFLNKHEQELIEFDNRLGSRDRTRSIFENVDSQFDKESSPTD